MKTMYKKIVLRSLMLLLAVGLVFGISSCSRDDDGGGSGGTHKVVFKGVGSEGVVIKAVGYNIGTELHTKTDLSVNTWTSEEYTFTGNTPLNVAVNAVGTNANSTLKAQIFVDGKLVKESTSTGTYLSTTAAYNYE